MTQGSHQQGKFSQLLNETSSIQDEFSKLPPHIIWLHYIDPEIGLYQQASDCLLNMAQEEQRSFGRHKVFFLIFLSFFVARGSFLFLFYLVLGFSSSFCCLFNWK